MYHKIKGNTPYFAYDKFHNGPDCFTHLFTGPTAVWVACSSCKVLAPVETVGYRVSLDEAMNPAPPEEKEHDDSSNSKPDGD